MFALDVADLAPRVSCPTVAFHSRGDQLIFFEQGRTLGALIPGARFVPQESKNHVAFREEPAWQALAGALRSFLDDGGGTRSPSQAKELTSRQLDVLRGTWGKKLRPKTEPAPYTGIDRRPPTADRRPPTARDVGTKIEARPQQRKQGGRHG